MELDLIQLFWFVLNNNLLHLYYMLCTVLSISSDGISLVFIETLRTITLSSISNRKTEA